MEPIKEFVCYPFVRLRWTIATWWSMVKGHLGLSASMGLAAFVIGLGIHWELLRRWPVLKDSVGDPMSVAWNYLIYGILGVVGLHVAGLVVLLVAAPSQIYREQKNKIKSLTPPPLNLMFRVGASGVTSRGIHLEEVTITNRSSRKMDLTFRVLLEDAAFNGAWYGPGYSGQDGQSLAVVESESTVTGALMFRLTHNVSLDGCILEISDAISNAAVRCKPTHGFPEGRV